MGYQLRPSNKLLTEFRFGSSPHHQPVETYRVCTTYLVLVSVFGDHWLMAMSNSVRSTTPTVVAGNKFEDVRHAEGV